MAVSIHFTHTQVYSEYTPVMLMRLLHTPAAARGQAVGSASAHYRQAGSFQGWLWASLKLLQDRQVCWQPKATSWHGSYLLLLSQSILPARGLLPQLAAHQINARLLQTLQYLAKTAFTAQRYSRGAEDPQSSAEGKKNHSKECKPSAHKPEKAAASHILV